MKKILELKNKSVDEKKHKSNVLSEKEILKIYSSLELPKIKNSDKPDYLEFYLYFGDNLSKYKTFKSARQKLNLSWKDFAYYLSNITANDIQR